MPYNINPHKDCTSCVGKCISYIREQSKQMKDRDTQYRIAQKKLIACTYENLIPGFDKEGLGNKTFQQLINQSIANGKKAGEFIEANIPSHFGSNVEQQFFLTSGQIGKVSGDIFEILIRAILWNSNVYLSNLNIKITKEIEDIFSNHTENKYYLAVALGDNFDLKKIFNKEAKKEFESFEMKLKKKRTSFCYSTPDFIVIKCVNNDIWNHFSRPINNLSIENQDLLFASKLKIEGKIDPSDIVLAAGLKTSIRSDRMYQLLFEANAWKAIWRTIFNLKPSKYYSIIGQSYGADPNKLNSVEFSSLNDLDSIEKAIDGLIKISTPFDLIKWYAESIA